MKHIDIVFGHGSVKDEEIQEVERELGVKFPSSFINSIINNDKGVPKRNCFKVLMPNDEEWGSCIGCFLSFSKNNNQKILKFNKEPAEGFPSGYIAFAEDGGGDFICFDYSNNKNNDDPSIVYWSHEFSHLNNGISLLSNSFDDFMDMLYEPEDKYW
jgi:hypothetical protein